VLFRPTGDMPLRCASVLSLERQRVALLPQTVTASRRQSGHRENATDRPREESEPTPQRLALRYLSGRTWVPQALWERRGTTGFHVVSGPEHRPAAGLPQTCGRCQSVVRARCRFGGVSGEAVNDECLRRRGALASRPFNRFAQSGRGGRFSFRNPSHESRRKETLILLAERSILWPDASFHPRPCAIRYGAVSPEGSRPHVDGTAG
jgi:hypothetical protein